MNLETIAGKKTCGGAEGANTGKLGCQITLSTPESIIGMPKGYVIPKETDFTLEYVTSQIQAGIFTPIIGAENFEDLSSEDAYNTNPSGVKRLNVPGLPEYKLTYEEGHEFYKQLSKLQSYKVYDFAVIDDEGSWALATNSNGDYKGFSAGHVTPEQRRNKVKGGENEMKALLIQFLSRNEWDRNYEIFQAEELGFSVEDIPSVNGIDMTFGAIPADTETSLKVDIFLSSDRTTPIQGLDVDDFGLLNGTVALVPSLVTETTPGHYDLTVTALAAGDVITLDTATDIINSNDVLYRAVATTETVIA